MYRAFVHYHFKKGMEEEGLKFLNNELLKHAKDYGCHGIELLYNEREPSEVLGIGLWNSLEEAKSFQSLWDKKEKELVRYCTNVPKREFFKIEASYLEKSKKAA